MIEKLKQLLKNSYSKIDNNPYSSIVIMKDGKQFYGVNLKNVIYRDSIYAEQTAIGTAIASGYKKGDFKEIYIMSGSKELPDENNICISIIKEFFEKDSKVHIYNIDGQEREIII